MVGSRRNAAGVVVLLALVDEAHLAREFGAAYAAYRANRRF